MADAITATGTAGTLQYSGLTSDTKWADIVDSLVKLERININRMESWKSEWEDKNTVIKQLESHLLVLESKAGDLNSYRELKATTSSSSDEDVLMVTSTSFASTGAHSITVGTDISHMLASQGLSSTTEAIGVIGQQDLVIEVGSNTITVDYSTPAVGNGEFDSNSTLEDLVTAINNDPENNNYLTASIKDEGSGVNRYRLVLTANTGGADNRISITSNPLQLNFNTNFIGNTVETTWTGASATSIGRSTAIENKTYTFTASGSGTVGQAGSLLVNWDDGTGNTGSINVGSGYTAGTALSVADGIEISFGSGNITSGEAFNVNVYNNIEPVQQIDWSDTLADPQQAGVYTGNTNKIFNFAILDSGQIGTDEIRLYWEDSEGNSDTITIPSTYQSGDEIDIYQGVKVKFDTSIHQNVDENAKFSIQVLHPALQAGQDTGLAQTEIETHSGFADVDRSYVSTSEGTFSYTYAGITRNLTVPIATTLTALASIINSDNDNPGVTAIIVNDGSGLSTAYHLQLIGRDTGAAYKIEDIQHTLDTLAGNSSNSYGFTETQAGQNAMIKVDGFPMENHQYIQRSSNTVGDIISGVTLSLLSTGDSTVSVTIDTSTIVTNIQEFVDSLNNALDYVTAMTSYIEAGDKKYVGPMIGNYSFQMVQQRINRLLTSAIPGLSDGTDAYTLLSQIGISTQEDQITIQDADEVQWTKTTRRWTLDVATLSEALTNDFDAVANLFIFNDATGVNGIAELIKDEADTLSKEYTAENPGILEVLKKNYEGIISNIEAKIEREEIRISMVEDRMNMQFTRLETLLGQLDGQKQALKALLDANNNNDD